MTVMFVLRGVHEFTTKPASCQAWAACLLWRAELGTPPGSTVKDSQESKLRCRDFKTFRDLNGFHVSWMLHNWLLACCWVWPRFRLERCKSSRMLASKHRWCQQVPASQSSRSLTVGYSHVISQATANIYHQNTNSLQNVQINIPLKPKWKPFSQLISTEYLLYLLWCNKTNRMVPLDP